jgi:hypothetical protein
MGACMGTVLALALALAFVASAAASAVSTQTGKDALTVGPIEEQVVQVPEAQGAPANDEPASVNNGLPGPLNELFPDQTGDSEITDVDAEPGCDPTALTSQPYEPSVVSSTALTNPENTNDFQKSPMSIAALKGTIPGSGGSRSSEPPTLSEAGNPPAPDVWAPATPVPGGIVRYAWAYDFASNGNSFYIISGVDSTFNLVTNTWRYDADVDTWTALAPIPVGQEGPSAIMYGDNIYVAGGTGSTLFYIYSISGNSWSAGAALPRGVWGAAMGAWNGYVYLIGGDPDFNWGGSSNEVNIYEIASNTWIGTGAPMPTPRSAMGWLQGLQWVVVVGGWGNSAPAANEQVTEVYDMVTNTWSSGPVFTPAKADFALALSNVNGLAYAIGGDASGGGAFDATADVWRLDLIAMDAWVAVADPIPIPVSANPAGFYTNTLVGGEVWSVGGAAPGLTIIGQNVWREGFIPSYAFDLTPAFQVDFGVPGVNVDYTLSITNNGLNDDPYDLTVAGNAWPVVFRDIGDTMDITSIGVDAGNVGSFIARVSVPGPAVPGEVDIADITATSQGEPTLSHTAQVQTALPLTPPFFDDMESGPDGWRFDGLWHQVFDTTSPYPNYWSYETSWWYGQDTTGDYDTGTDNFGRLASPWIDLTGSSSAWLSFYEWYETEDGYPMWDQRWVQVNDGTGWQDIEHLDENFMNQWAYARIDLSAYTGSIIQVGFYFDTIDDEANDYRGWYVDDVYLNDILLDNFEMTPEFDNRLGLPGIDVNYTLTISNIGVNDDIYDLTVVGTTWPVVFRDIGDTMDITTLDVLAGTMDSFIARVSIPGGTPWSSSDVAYVIATSQNDAMVLDWSELTTRTPYEVPYFDDMESGPDSWTATPSPGTTWELGDPMGFGPGAAYSGDNCWGTNLLSNYENSANCILTSPQLVTTGVTTLRLSFYMWLRSESGWDPGWVEVSTDGVIYTLVEPELGPVYADSVWGPRGYMGSTGGWVYAQFDLSAYAGGMLWIQFHFVSDTSVTYPGWYIDDVSVYSPVLATATGPIAISSDPMPTITYTTVNIPTSVEIYYSVTLGVSWTLWGTDATVDGTWAPSAPLPSEGEYYWNARALGLPDEPVPTSSIDVEAGPYIIDTTPPVSNIIQEDSYWQSMNPMTMYLNARDSILEESFSGPFPPTGWTTSGLSVSNQGSGTEDLTHYWWRYDDSRYDLTTSPPYCAGLWWSNGNGGDTVQDEWLMTPSLDFTGYTALSLSFQSVYMWSGVATFYNDVAVSTDGGGSWTTIADLIQDAAYEFGGSGTGGAGWNWHEVPIVIDISPYCGLPNVMFAWHYYRNPPGTGQAIWMIDDVKIGSSSGVASIDISYRFSADNVTFGAWTLFTTIVGGPWQFDFSWPDGQGYYEVYSVATDNAGNVEGAPASADAAYAFEANAPSSNVIQDPMYWIFDVPDLILQGVASDDLSGVAYVELWYTWAPDNGTWISWTMYGVATTPPYQWDFVFPVDGYYQFFSIAYDVAGNFEGWPAVPDAFNAYNAAPPESYVIQEAPYVWDHSPRPINANAYDTGNATVLTETFDAGAWPPTGWSTSALCTGSQSGYPPLTHYWTQYDDNVIIPLLGAPLSYSFPYYAGIWWSDGSSGDTVQDEWLITPPLDLTGYTTQALSFYSVYMWDADSFDPNYYNDIAVSTDGGGSWTPVADLIHDSTYELGTGGPLGYGWNYNEIPVTVDISAYCGLPSVLVAWHYYENPAGMGAAIWTVDDVTFYGNGPAPMTTGSVDLYYRFSTDNASWGGWNWFDDSTVVVQLRLA